MSGRPCKVLIFDWDQNVLIALQHALEDAGVDTTVTWDEAEARKLVKNTPFDMVLVGDHPPELTAETILHAQAASCPCLILRAGARQQDTEQVRDFGIVDVVPKRDAWRVLQEVQEHWHSKGSDTKATSTDSVEASLRAAA